MVKTKKKIIEYVCNSEVIVQKWTGCEGYEMVFKNKIAWLEFDSFRLYYFCSCKRIIYINFFFSKMFILYGEWVYVIIRHMMNMNLCIQSASK